MAGGAPTGGVDDVLEVAGGSDVLPGFVLLSALVVGDCDVFNCSFFTMGSERETEKTVNICCYSQYSI